MNDSICQTYHRYAHTFLMNSYPLSLPKLPIKGCAYRELKYFLLITISFIKRFG